MDKSSTSYYINIFVVKYSSMQSQEGVGTVSISCL